MRKTLEKQKLTLATISKPDAWDLDVDGLSSLLVLAPSEAAELFDGAGPTLIFSTFFPVMEIFKFDGLGLALAFEDEADAPVDVPVTSIINFGLAESHCPKLPTLGASLPVSRSPVSVLTTGTRASKHDFIGLVCSKVDSVASPCGNFKEGGVAAFLLPNQPFRLGRNQIFNEVVQPRPLNSSIADLQSQLQRTRAYDVVIFHFIFKLQIRHTLPTKVLNCCSHIQWMKRKDFMT